MRLSPRCRSGTRVLTESLCWSPASAFYCSVCPGCCNLSCNTSSGSLKILKWLHFKCENFNAFQENADVVLRHTQQIPCSIEWSAQKCLGGTFPQRAGSHIPHLWVRLSRWHRKVMPSLPSPAAKFPSVDAPITAASNMWDGHPLFLRQSQGQNPGLWRSDTFTFPLELLQWNYFGSISEPAT